MKRQVLYFIMCLFAITSANSQVTSVAIVGEAVGGWPGDAGNPGPTDIHQMTSVDGINWTINNLVVTNATVGGGAKFRANNDWTINWGSASFPSGTGTQGGANIVTIGGTYNVSFNSSTGAYSFAGGPPISVVHLFGNAVNAPPEGLQMTTSDANVYTLSNVTLLGGTAQFNIDGSVYGGNTFPAGLISDATQFIPVVAGDYTSVTLNLSTQEYTFVAAPVYPVISIIGNGAQGWSTDTNLSTTDGITYTGTLPLTAWDGIPGSGTGEIKFRTNHDWSQPNYGGVTFPTGPDPSNLGGNIVVTAAGTYSVTFNRTTGAYAFTFPTIAIVGSATPGGWPSDPQVDPSPLTTTDGVNYVLDHITLVTGDAKFRQNNNWDVNWGTASFPAGTGTQGGGNIPVTAGNYRITFDRTTGAFNFTPSLATAGFASKNYSVYPNPTANNWNISSVNGAITSVQIVDVLGKVVSTTAVSSSNATVDASALTNGVYFARIATATATETVKLIKN